LGFFIDLGHMQAPADAGATPWRALIPAFVIGELRRAFEMGFLLFLPFLVIDLVVASVLMSLGMMMLPPSSVSLPFKLIFFVTIDGWRLISGSLVQSFLSGGG
jgi:flagellar biosynthetic protein FliP